MCVSGTARELSLSRNSEALHGIKIISKGMLVVVPSKRSLTLLQKLYSADPALNSFFSVIGGLLGYLGGLYLYQGSSQAINYCSHRFFGREQTTTELRQQYFLEAPTYQAG